MMEIKWERHQEVGGGQVRGDNHTIDSIANLMLFLF